METTTATVLGPRDGKAGFLGSIGVRFMIDGCPVDRLRDRCRRGAQPFGRIRERWGAVDCGSAL